MRALGIATICLWILSCTNAAEVVWVDDSGPSDGDTDIDTDSDSDDDSDSDTDAEDLECNDPCEEYYGYWIPGCMEPCYGFGKPYCSNEYLTCVPWAPEIGVCLPFYALFCGSSANCDCFPDIDECEASGGYTFWQCEGTICMPHCY